MNTLQKKVLIGLTVLGMATATFAAHAEKAGCEYMGGRMAMGGHEGGGAKFAEHMAKRQAELHDKLKLTAAQEAGWKTYAASMTPPAATAQGERGAIDKLSVPERMEKMLSMMKEHEAHMAARLAALKTFYATLTADQQKIFNDNAGHRHHRHGDSK